MISSISWGSPSTSSSPGNYKSFGEPFIRTNRSVYTRARKKSILLAMFVSNIFPEIQKSRKLKQGVDELLSKGPYGSAQAYEAGLVDRVAYREEVLESLRMDGVVFRSAAALFVDRERRWESALDPSIAVIEINGSITASTAKARQFPLRGGRHGQHDGASRPRHGHGQSRHPGDPRARGFGRGLRCRPAT